MSDAPTREQVAQAIHDHRCIICITGAVCALNGKPGKYDYSLADALMPLIRAARAEALREAADKAECRFRSMSFSCGAATSETRPHPVGKWLRERAEYLEDK